MKKPLDGVRIADLTQAWAGSFATQILGDAGADVIKVEARRRPDPWRGGFEGERGLPTYPGDEPGRHPYNRSYLANSVNRNKRGITLDLADARGRELFLDLVETADLVMENFTPRVLDNLGIGFETLQKRKKNIVLVSMPAFGLTGPHRDFPGIGGTIEPLSGNSFLLSLPGEGPRVSGAMYPDPVAGITGACAAMLGLREYGLKGDAVHLEVSQQEAMIAMLGEFFATGAGHHEDAIGNADLKLAPNGIYRTDDSQWIALSVRSDSEWRALCELPWFDSASGEMHGWCEQSRRESRAMIDEWLGTVFGCLTADDALAALIPVGLCAAKVGDIASVLSNAQLRASNFFARMFQPGVGAHDVSGPLVSFDSSPWQVQRPAPGHGSDSRNILCDLLGVDPDEYNALEADGVTGQGPPPA